jgi:hypothetical protein
MGRTWFDQYSLLHLAVGIVAYFWSISLFMTILIHILFEIIENTHFGMNLINTYFQYWWPGGKPYSDNLLNSTTDTIFTGLGWLIAYNLDMIYKNT